MNLQDLADTDIAKILVLGMVTTVCLSSLSFMTKYWQTRYKYDSTQFGADSLMLLGMILLPFFMYYHFKVGYTYRELVFGTIGGIISSSGNIFLYHLVSKSISSDKDMPGYFHGPSVHTILAVIFLSSTPSSL